MVDGDLWYLVKVLEKYSASEESMLASVLTRGDCFGERGDDEMSMSALATGDVTCLVIDKEVFKKVTEGLDDALKIFPTRPGQSPFEE
ncbi:cGMP-dependent protein kinase 1-like [Carassius auratus]|uniref:cGMP-dependent protein kinase 1-like n=1 Tax=Carassius auratus TaxID=7957 RepID=A0A6P6J5Z6_CARAU|nr:cGMP-dependent protein kinase 1-like [Carassius auratus]